MRALKHILVCAAVVAPQLIHGQEPVARPVPRTPEWFREAVVYQVFLRSYSQEGKFYALENDFSKLKTLGVNCISLLPVQPTDTASGGTVPNPYLIKDYDAVSLEYGTKDGFKSFVEQAQLNEYRVILDWVMDRISSESPLVKEHPDWFSLNEDNADTAVLNYNSKELRSYLKKLMVNWIREYGMDGFRLVGSESVPEDYIQDLAGEIVYVKPSAVVLLDSNRSVKGTHGKTDESFYTGIAQAALKQIPASQLAEYLVESSTKSEPWPMPMRYLELVGGPRIAQFLGKGAFPAAVLLYTSNGIPILQSGQEISELNQTSLYKKDVINWEEGFKKNSDTRKFYKTLAHLRLRHPAFARGQKFSIRVGEPNSVYAFAATFREDAVLVAVNFSENRIDGVLDLPDIFLNSSGRLGMKPVFFDGSLDQMNANSFHLKLPPWGFQIWELK